MILTCPDCATRYLTKPEAIGPNGRTVRCASCSATWFVSAEEAAISAADKAPDSLSPAAPAAPVVKTSRPKPVSSASGRSVSDPVNNAPDIPRDDFIAPSAASLMREQTEAKRASRRLMSVGAMWLVTLALLSVGALSAYVFRQSIVDKYPKAATVYKAFGLDVSTGGLVFGTVISRPAYVEGVPTLIVNGEVHNPGKETQAASLVQLSALSPSGEPLISWQMELPKSELAGGETLSFVSHYPNPPVDARRVQYKFAADNVAAKAAAPASGNTAPATLSASNRE